MSLKAMMTAALSALGVLVLAAAASLGLLTSYLHRVTNSLGSSVEGVRLAEEMEVELLRHSHQAEVQPLADASARSLSLGINEAGLRSLLDQMEPLASSSEEQELMRDIRRKVDAYLLAREQAPEGSRAPVSARVSPELEDAMNALEQLVEFNVQEAHYAQAQANRWDTVAELVGTTLAVLLLVGMTVVFFWLRRSVLRPVMQMSHAMRRFGSGSKRTRAPETGPTELREMARTFNEMATSLARQQEDQLTFLAGVAHELRNPLSALKMSTALVDPERPDISPARLQKMLTLVRRQVARLDRMVGDLLDATRIEAGQLELQLEERDARELARGVVELYQSTGAGHELNLSLPESAVLLRCDGARIEQVLNNLVSNALKYSPAGTQVSVSVAQEDEEVLLSVADQGIGISAEEQPHLFVPFHRAHGARKRATGAGLGLSVARRIVEAHGGTIEVDSQPGQGSVFRVRLPRLRAVAPVPDASVAPPPWAPGGAVH
ncbi:HAMP domain-containing sensor histidine kinase [Hyalangium gracile]|uniref:HAMP domain-containing sensor histidine kinase n=1 Tax=Hyalangium gracile TaxID=394092 RepID=UPI001CCD069C|nr:ATP-binding protein [Hyalangium gracile]